MSSTPHFYAISTIPTFLVFCHLHEPLSPLPHPTRAPHPNLQARLLIANTPLHRRAPYSQPDPTRPRETYLLALQLTCHQLQAESAGIICRVNDFVLRYTDEQRCCAVLRDFLSDIDSTNARAVRKIIIEFDT